MISRNLPSNELFADVVSVDAWFKPGDTPLHHDLHLDVAFGESRVGGEPASKVRFRLALRRAQIVVILTPSEPAKVIKASVSRDERLVTATKFSRRNFSSKVAASAAADGQAGSSTPEVKVALKAEARTEIAKDEALEAKEEFQSIGARQGITSEGYYKWDVRPSFEGILNGRPWSALNSPRLTVFDERLPQKRNLPITASIEVRCLREDLEISSIELKDDAAWRLFLASRFHKAKIVAAEAYIRNKLATQGFPVSDLSEKFASIVMSIKFLDIA